MYLANVLVIKNTDDFIYWCRLYLSLLVCFIFLLSNRNICCNFFQITLTASLLQTSLFLRITFPPSLQIFFLFYFFSYYHLQIFSIYFSSILSKFILSLSPLLPSTRCYKYGNISHKINKTPYHTTQQKICPSKNKPCNQFST